MSGVSERPYVLLSCAMSVDGYIDDTGSDRLLLSNDADFDRVDGQRALADAVLVGASTIRRDNPRLLVRSADRRSARQERGLPVSPAKVTITGMGNLDPQVRAEQVTQLWLRETAPRKCREFEIDLGAITVRQPRSRRSHKINMSRAVRPYSREGRRWSAEGWEESRCRPARAGLLTRIRRGPDGGGRPRTCPERAAYTLGRVPVRRPASPG